MYFLARFTIHQFAKDNRQLRKLVTKLTKFFSISNMLELSGNILALLMLFAAATRVDSMGPRAAKPYGTFDEGCNLSDYSATTSGIADIFIGRCEDYIEILQKVNCEFNSSTYDCKQLWESFYRAASNYSYSIDTYNSFIKLADQEIPSSRSVFWSGSGDVVHGTIINPTK